MTTSRVDVERTLVLVRHGKSDWSHDVEDVDRPLAARGRRQASVSGQWLARELVRLDAARVSPAVRTQQTFAALTAAGVRVDDVVHEPALYCDTAQEVAAVVAGVPGRARSLLVVGHEPTFSDLVHQLTGRWVRIRTSEVVVLGWAGTWRPEAGAVDLLAIGRPPAEPGAGRDVH